MKIDDNIHMTDLSMIECGDCLRSGGRYYLKLSDDPNHTCRVADLIDGTIYPISGTLPVEPVSAKVVIE